jgi:hypothetical protein
MKSTKIIFFGILILAAVSGCGMMSKNKPAHKIMTHEELKAAWEKSMTKTEEHKLLEDMSGKWEAAVKFWAQPGANPNISAAKSVSKSVLDGKFLLEDYQGSFAGKPFQGMNIMGYDTVLKKFNNYWVDNMGTGAIYSEGSYDPATNTIALNGDVADPITQTKKPTYSTIKIIDKDNHLLEMFDIFPDGKKFKTLEIAYKRVL